MQTAIAPRISVIMVDGSYRERFHAVDFLERQTMPRSDYEILWVEYYGKAREELHSKSDRYGNPRIIPLSRTGTYHSSYCFNAGILASKSELIVIPDADVAVEEDFLEKVWEQHRENDKLVMYIHRYEEREEDYLPHITMERLRETACFNNPANYGGCITVRKKWLLEINGYEQHPVFGLGGYHANGLDVYTRLKNLGLHIMWSPELKLYHPWHPTGEGAEFCYELQKIMIHYRSMRRATLPFQGIDPSRNTLPPEELVRELERFARRNSSRLERCKGKFHSSLGKWRMWRRQGTETK